MNEIKLNENIWSKWELTLYGINGTKNDIKMKKWNWKMTIIKRKWPK